MGGMVCSHRCSESQKRCSCFYFVVMFVNNVHAQAANGNSEERMLEVLSASKRYRAELEAFLLNSAHTAAHDAKFIASLKQQNVQSSSRAFFLITV